MYYSHGSVFWMFGYLVLVVCGERDLFEKKCKRECNTEHGTLDCWERTTTGFAYGLSTAMIDYCQVILQLRQMNSQSWYNTSRDILIQQIVKYNLDQKVRHLTKNDIELVSTSLLNKCFYASSQSLFQPSCPSCSLKQIQLIKQWRLLILILTSTCLLFFSIILFLYTYHIRHTRRSYQSIG